MGGTSKEYGLIYVAHIPRTGGNAVKLALRLSDAGHRDWETTKEALAIQREWANYKRNTGMSVWDGYFKFALVRNPFDLLPSLYYLPNRSDIRAMRPSWEDFVRDPILKPGGEGTQRLPQSNIIGPEVDFIMKFENLAEDFENMLAAAGISKPYPALPPPEPYSLLNATKTPPNVITPDRLPYQQYYTEPWMIEAVYENFAADFERFGYEWEEEK